MSTQSDERGARPGTPQDAAHDVPHDVQDAVRDKAGEIYADALAISERKAADELREATSKVTDADAGRILGKIREILGKLDSPALRDLADQVRLLIALVGDWRSGRYRQVPWSTVASAIGALVYVLTTLDLIPDIIPVLGLVDDASVVALCVSGIRADLEKYRAWKAENPQPGEASNEIKGETPGS